MELLDRHTVLREASRVLKQDTGELWASFQWDQQNGECSTAHQNVHGCTLHTVEQDLERAGFQVVSIDKCECAFRTPSPLQDGSLAPVPYLFVVARVQRDKCTGPTEEALGLAASA